MPPWKWNRHINQKKNPTEYCALLFAMLTLTWLLVVLLNGYHTQRQRYKATEKKTKKPKNIIPKRVTKEKQDKIKKQKTFGKKRNEYIIVRRFKLYSHIHTETSTSVFPHSIQPQIIQNHFFFLFFGFACGESEPESNEQRRGRFVRHNIFPIVVFRYTVTTAPPNDNQQNENGAAARYTGLYLPVHC